MDIPIPYFSPEIGTVIAYFRSRFGSMWLNVRRRDQPNLIGKMLRDTIGSCHGVGKKQLYDSIYLSNLKFW